MNNTPQPRDDTPILKGNHYPLRIEIERAEDGRIDEQLEAFASEVSNKSYAVGQHDLISAGYRSPDELGNWLNPDDCKRSRQSYAALMEVAEDMKEALYRVLSDTESLSQRHWLPDHCVGQINEALAAFEALKKGNL